MNLDLQILFSFFQSLYFFSFLIVGYFVTRPVNWVNVGDHKGTTKHDYPFIVLFYPVLKESIETMRTTMLGLQKLDYPKHQFRIIALPNLNDHMTLESLEKLKKEIFLLEVMPVPPTTDDTWNAVWKAWDKNPEATWWHTGPHKKNKNLPPKKTRQMVYAFYRLQEEFKQYKAIDDWLLNYIDADSVPKPNHFLAAVAGMKKYDVLQSTNIAGNLLQSYAATWCAMDHLNWDYKLYPHMSANGKHPFWVLGKGLFFKSSDLVNVGGFDPWVAIEDPDIGLRLWAKGKKIGIISEPLIEEVPVTLERCIIQRKRWMCGFLQSTFGENKLKGVSMVNRFKAYINLAPVLSLAINWIGLPIGIWVLVVLLLYHGTLSPYLTYLSIINIVCYVVTLLYFYASAWSKIGQVLESNWDKIRFMVRVNPLFLWFFWFIWMIPMYQGFRMFFGDGGLVWQRTKKIDANHVLIRSSLSP